MTTPTAFSLRRDLALTAWQVRYSQRAFWRNRRPAILSIVFPLMFLIVFGSLNNGHIDTRGNLSFIDFYVPGIVAYAIILTCFNTTALGFAALRANGVLKRLRVTPLPWWVFVAGTVGSTLLVVTLSVAIMLTVGILVFGAHLHTGTLPGFLLTLVLGCACFTTLGVGAARLIAKPENGMGILVIITLPLMFISNIFFPLDGAPGWLNDVARVFPFRALADGLQVAFDPRTKGDGIVSHDLLVLAIWTAVGARIMLRFLQQLVSRA
jgi:ABC-2 type transport system permease protein